MLALTYNPTFFAISSPFEVEINGKKINGAVLSDHIKNLDWKAREIKFIEKAKGDVVAEVITKISVLIID